MKREDILFKKLLSANRGDKKAKWEIINMFEKKLIELQMEIRKLKILL